MNEPIFLAPVFQEKIWGGKRLHDIFGYTLPSNKIGECWAISAHPNGPCTVLTAPYQGKKLNELWDEHRELFGNQKGDVFPLLTKILDAEDDLSVQVHPDDAYGLAHEGELGKTECWYVIDAAPGSEIIYGHHAKTKAELEAMIADEKWDQLLKRVPVKAGDFFYVPAGTIHAIGKGILILETQQSSDTTYRIYDYDRKDDHGKKRPLHIQQTIDVTNVPDTPPQLNMQQVNKGDSSIVTFVKAPFFNVYQWLVKGRLSFTKQAPYTLVSVLGGAGQLVIEDVKTNREKSYELSLGEHFILPSQVQKWRIQGDMMLIASEPGEALNK